MANSDLPPPPANPSVDSGSSTTTESIQPTITNDSSHPFYLHPSGSPGMMLVNSIFDDGSITEPTTSSPSFKAWNMCNDMVISCLLNSLSKEIAESVLYSKTAKEIWKELEDRFGQSNGALLYQLQKELSDLVQGNSDVVGYYTMFKRIWDELDSFDTCVHCSCECSCGRKSRSLKSQQDGRFIQFLMGLNEAYSGVKSNILMGSPLPSINHAYSMLIQEEKQKEIHVAQHPVDSAFMAAKQQYGAQKFVNTEKKGNFEGKRNNIICNYCKKPGHTAERCYRIIGFPTDFKFTKNKRFQNGVHGNVVLTADDNANQSVANAERGITQEQYNNICQLLQ
ncbi:PREDICTED: uncharacterized protein LOC109232261 [Nicotiana attenuata]|uniref:uncharacterized protein LOC109232261 n=1 Tax=Nicotiana attenuata TaxID=49451 RepID=UPI000904979C|nr:PREDICTED: uncharacterized protein LOC109232261 [Nicotiana attenuata]